MNNKNIMNKVTFGFFSKGHERTKKAKINIALSFILKVTNIATGLLLVPLVLNYLDETRYGIWLTLSSLVAWFTFFDVGLGHGLRNKLAESQAKGDESLSRKYVSTTYAGLAIISSLFFILFLIVNIFLDWSKILNTTLVPKHELNLLAIIVFGFFAMNLVFKLIQTILLANQSPAMVNLIQTSGSVLNLIIVYLLFQITTGKLIYLGITYSAVPVLILVAFSIILFTKKYNHLSPKFKFVDFSLFGDLFKLGSKFFLIQIAAVILYSTDNMIITQLFSPADVTPYNIAHKYFSILMIGFSIIVAPFWSAITEAYTKHEFTWIKKSVSKLLRIWLILIIFLFIMLIFSNKIYYLWLGDKVTVPFALSIAWFIFVAINSLGSIFVAFINGTGYLRLQMVIGLSAAVVNIPLSILLAKQCGLGVTGVILATLITQIIGVSLYIIQYNKIMNGKLNGLWGGR